jgi:alkanesulfonate monooxygenase SsuD/methylene tetrahydromethanopterin reductase-like flavin-dependent oxidoreductase (luciferase family)
MSVIQIYRYTNNIFGVKTDKNTTQHDDRYALAEEYVKVTYKLWESSWRQDAVVLDRERGIYTDPARVRQINHVGKYYNVPGPHICHLCGRS